VLGAHAPPAASEWRHLLVSSVFFFCFFEPSSAHTNTERSHSGPATASGVGAHVTTGAKGRSSLSGQTGPYGAYYILNLLMPDRATGRAAI
jgi:hypothetical protein